MESEGQQWREHNIKLVQYKTYRKRIATQVIHKQINTFPGSSNSCLSMTAINLKGIQLYAAMTCNNAIGHEKWDTFAAKETSSSM